MALKKILFIDRDGTLIEEPEDKQIDKLDKLKLMPYVIPALLALKRRGYIFVMVTNQDGLGTESFPQTEFDAPHNYLIELLRDQGITFEAIRICPHFSKDACDCRKPKIGLVLDYLRDQTLDRESSYVIGDRMTDMEFAEQLGIQGLQFGENNWQTIAKKILSAKRTATVTRVTQETNISATVSLDEETHNIIDTGLGFFNHMLEQLAKHGGFNLSLKVKGDLDIDDHHTVEDTAIVLGDAVRKALGDKWGIGRYGFLLPMDESIAEVAIDLSGRSYFVFEGKFSREKVGDLSTELVPHFFRSFAESLKATLHISIKGENTHHMVEAIFKAVGRVLRQAMSEMGEGLPTTKGVL